MRSTSFFSQKHKSILNTKTNKITIKHQPNPKVGIILVKEMLTEATKSSSQDIEEPKLEGSAGKSPINAVDKSWMSEAGTTPHRQKREIKKQCVK